MIKLQIDLRKIQINYNQLQGLHIITMISENGIQLGYFEFKVYNQDRYIYITNVFVYPEYQNIGIGQLLFKEFGKIYLDKYNGFELKQIFINPIAEYAYRKAISLEYIPQLVLNEEKIRRTYNDADEYLINDLRKKLPKEVKGPENWK